MLFRSAYHDPHVPTYVDGAGVERRSTDLPALLGSSDVIVVLAAHRAIDWATVYGSGSLVVDTVDSSRGQATQPRQVLRLGAGWSARA